MNCEFLLLISSDILQFSAIAFPLYIIYLKEKLSYLDHQIDPAEIKKNTIKILRKVFELQIQL